MMGATAAFDPVAPFAYDFFVRALVVAALAGALCGLIGVFVVLRSMSYIGHGLSHAVFGGAAVAAVMGWSYAVGAGVWGVLAGLLILRVARTGTLGSDAAIGVVTTSSFAIGLAIQARSGSADRSLDAVLFGDVLGVQRIDVVSVGLVVVVVAGFVYGWRRELTFATFDPVVARVSGVRVAWVDAALILAISVTVVVSVRVIGALLVSAMLVLPAATARLLTESISRMLWTAPAFGAGSGLIGLYVSWYADIPSGAAITLVGAAGFGVAYLVSDATRRRALARMDQHGVLA